MSGNLQVGMQRSDTGYKHGRGGEAHWKVASMPLPNSHCKISKAAELELDRPHLCSSRLAASRNIITPGLGLEGSWNRVSSGGPPPSSSCRYDPTFDSSKSP